MKDYIYIENNKDYSLINNAHFKDIISSKYELHYTLLFFCLSKNKGNVLATSIASTIFKLFNTINPTYRELVKYSAFLSILVNLIILFLIIAQIYLLSDFIIELFIFTLILALLSYFMVQVTLDSINTIQLKVANFSLGSSEIRNKYVKEGYESIVLKRFLVNTTSNNQKGFIYIHDYTNDYNPDSSTRRKLFKLWPVSSIVGLVFKIRKLYIRYYFVIKYYLKHELETKELDNNDLCCLKYLKKISDEITILSNKSLCIDRAVVICNNEPIYHCGKNQITSLFKE